LVLKYIKEVAMMKNKKILLSLILIPLLFSCATNPEAGYISDEEAKNTANAFKDQNYTKYSFTGSMNFLTINAGQYDKSESNGSYNVSTKSYYLNLPTFINSENYDSSYTIIKNKFQTGTSVYTLYKYNNNGGLDFKVFACNKRLMITKYGMELSAKWNLCASYDSNGYLLKEEFSTINSFKDPDNKTIYGKCTYTYSL